MKIGVSICIILIISSCVSITDNIKNNNEKIKIFASRGFGFEYNDEEIQSLEIFLQNHKNPDKYSENIVQNMYNGLEDKIITLYYEKIIVKFYVSFDKSSRLLGIYSKDNIEYLYSIKHGMEKEKIINILGGETEIKVEDYLLFDGYKGNRVQLMFENNKLKNIIWNDSLE